MHIQLFNYSDNLNTIIRRKFWITELFCTFVSNSRIMRIVSHKKLKEFYEMTDRLGSGYTSFWS